MRLVLGLLLITPLFAMAETAYVTDNLRLGLHQAEDTSDRAFRTLESGQEIEILSRTRNYAHVRLPDGVEGYVKAAYLVTEKPAKLVVAETRAEADRVAAELEALRRSFADPAATIDALRREADSLKSDADQRELRITELEADNADLRRRQEQFQFSLPFNWVAGAVIACLIGGFLAGLWWVDYRSRKRHGGIRIY